MMKSPPIAQLPLALPPDIRIIGNARTRLATVRQHHAEAWVLLFVHYHGSLLLANTWHELQPGTAVLLPPDTAMRIAYPAGALHRYAHLVVPTAGEARAVTTFTDLDADFVVLDHRFQAAIRHHSTFPARARMILWDLLWQLADRAGRHTPQATMHPALQGVLELLEARLAEAPSVAELAASCDLSQRQLHNLCRKELGMGLKAYMQQRQMERAYYLLTQTAQPIKVVAAEVGLPDVQHFNKVVRSTFGRSPTALRSTARAPE